jgi:glycerol-1-phosphate dehydrogenase [NAD(P)+]
MPKEVPDALYGQTIQCECGKTHRVEPYEVVYDPEALSCLAPIAAPYAPDRSVVVLMDVRTGEVAGRAAAEVLRQEGWRVSEVVVPDPSPGQSPACDEDTYRTVLGQCREGAVILPAGSGVLSDLGKWVASDLDVPYVCFATAASMNGYSSANIAASIDGVKTVVRGRPPKAVLSTPAILRDAPYEMTAAGLGDVLAKSVSSADWRMNHVLFADYYCARCNALVAGIEPLVMDSPDRLRSRDAQAIGNLFEALLLTGVAMTMAETSAPASGGEHLVSHTLDMMSSVDGVPHGMHGSQVGIGTILTSELYRRVMAIESPNVAEVAVEIDGKFWGPLAGRVEKEYAGKTKRIQSAAAMISSPDTWDRLRSELSVFVRQPGRIRDCLETAGGAFRAEDIGCTRERLLAALLHAHEIRSRFTILDLARLLGVLPAAAAEIVEEWA